jgi:hypothetical protein
MLAGLPARLARDAAIRAEHEDGGRTPDIEAADKFQVRLGVYLHVRDPVDQAGDLGQDPPGGPARRAERGGELDQGGARAERRAEFRPGEAAGRRARGRGASGHVPDPAVALAPGKAGHRGDGKRRRAHYQPGCHAL